MKQLTLSKRIIMFSFIIIWLAAAVSILLTSPALSFPETINPLTGITIGYLIGAPVIALISAYMYMIVKQRETL